MKNLLFLFGAGLLLAGCGGEKSEYESAYEKDRQVTENTDAPEISLLPPPVMPLPKLPFKKANMHKALS